uniref:Uncharacterized protein n=1 Tax=Glossina austeni TaxID=7395 RepID=A0A1A9VR98_GLOAU
MDKKGLMHRTRDLLRDAALLVSVGNSMSILLHNGLAVKQSTMSACPAIYLPMSSQTNIVQVGDGNSADSLLDVSHVQAAVDLVAEVLSSDDSLSKPQRSMDVI